MKSELESSTPSKIKVSISSWTAVIIETPWVYRSSSELLKLFFLVYTLKLS